MRYAAIFAGQGSQSVGMGREIYENFSSARKLLDGASQALGIDFAELLFTQNEKINSSEFTQPAILLTSLMAHAALSESFKFKPIFSLGHSLGEFSALATAGGLEAFDALKVVNLRGRLMQQDCEGKGAGMMVLLGLSDEAAEQICADARTDGLCIYAANYNCDGQLVVAGLKDDLEATADKFKNAGAKRAMLLNMSVASHCPLLQNAANALVAQLEPLLREDFAPVISNASAKIYSTKAEALELLKAQLTSPVLYKQSVKNHEDEVDCFVEFGFATLKGINKKITEKPTISISDMASLDEALKFLEGK